MCKLVSAPSTLTVAEAACRFVNLNYLGLHKILKKHDKKLPDLACKQFYIAQLHKQPWLRGEFSDVFVRLSKLFSDLRGDHSGVKNEDASQVCLLASNRAAVTMAKPHDGRLL